MKLIDLNYLKENVGIDEDMIKEISAIFIEQMEEMNKIFNNALESNDIETIKQAAHKIKSSLRTFGIFEVANNFEQIELNAENLDYNTLKENILSNLKICNQAAEELKQII